MAWDGGNDPVAVEGDEEEDVSLLVEGGGALSVEAGKSSLGEDVHPPIIYSLIVFTSAFFAALQYCIVLPSLLSYAEDDLDGPFSPAMTAGLIVGGADLVSIAVLYGSAGLFRSQWMAIGGRIVAACVCSYSFTCPSFIGSCVGARHRTMYLSILYSSVYTGVALGPMVGAMLALFGEAEVRGLLRWNEKTAPGYAMGVVFFLFLCMVLAAPAFPKSASGTEGGASKAKARRERLKLVHIAVVVLTTLPAFLDGSFELATTTIAEEEWGFSATESGFYLGSILSSILMANGAAAYLSYRCGDRILILWGLCALVASFPFFFVRPAGKAAIVLFTIGGLLIMPAVSVISSCAASLTTKVDEQRRILLQTVNGIGLQIGLFLAALFGTQGYSMIGRSAFFSTLLCLALTIAGFFASAYRELRPET
ncbi:hypothetical protein A3770_06p42490 [Chloropicon primus]|uniref:MFS general substrate transporter n=1 Tax=Chloropicon primus TaxID=1764295 RepID=A0A5B8MN71_9CHLO|nr:hypothetical protein A3770_06p42490 [Chloropicon primus]|eukprot:QDZ21731.1 hypothetical protein A3770_06p42490 [Chloropicon primus]